MLDMVDLCGVVMYVSGYLCLMCFVVMYCCGICMVYFVYLNEDGEFFGMLIVVMYVEMCCVLEGGEL